MERFWSKVQKGQHNECWPWLGSKTKQGYGRFCNRMQYYLSHRFAYELVNGVIPEGQVVRHMCDNPRCCNPSHLELGTRQDNADDMVNRGRSMAGTKNPAVKITPEIVRDIRTSQSSCRVLAKRFGISPTHVGRIKRREMWAHIV